LKKHLIEKFGSITAAWKYGLDLSGNGRVSHTEFCAACRNNGFEGNISKCFKDADVDGSGVITFDEVDHDWCVKHKRFMDLLLQKYGTYHGAWVALNISGSNQPGVEEFVRICVDMGYTDDKTQLFKQLLKNQGRRYLTAEDLDSSNMFSSKNVFSQSKTNIQA